MESVWSWLASLPSVSSWPPLDAPPPSLPLAASPDISIVLQANRTDTDALVTFSLAIRSPHAASVPAPRRVLWTSDPVPLSSPEASRLQLLTQLLDESIFLAPFLPRLNIKLDTEAVSAVLDASGPDRAPAFLSLALLLRLFWLCALDAPADAGFLFFRALGQEIGRALDFGLVLRAFLRAVGPDVEERFVRSLGYLLAKWCLLKEIQAGPKSSGGRPLPAAWLSYAADAHGLWVLKGYAPVLAMARVSAASPLAAAHEADESALRYGLAHQQLEAVAQLEYVVCGRDPRFLRVGVRIDNVRIHVVRLGFRKDSAADEDEEDDDEDIMESERHFPSRVRVFVGPELGAAYATGPSLGRSTGNPDREVEMTRTIKGGFAGAAKGNGGGSPRIKAKMRSSARLRNRSWRWEQEAAGGGAMFEGVLCDAVTGTEVASWRPGSGRVDPRNRMRRRYGGPGRAFSKMRGLVVAGDELPEEVTWRVGREMEGRKVRWRLGLKVWVSYFPNEVRSGWFETRCVEWGQEVELPLVEAGGRY